MVIVNSSLTALQAEQKTLDASVVSRSLHSSKEDSFADRRRVIRARLKQNRLELAECLEPPPPRPSYEDRPHYPRSKTMRFIKRNSPALKRLVVRGAALLIGARVAKSMPWVRTITSLMRRL